MAEEHTNKVELIGFYGGDLEHSLSAWTSTSRDLDPEKRARIPALLAKLAKDGHHTPFEKSMLHFLVTCDQATHIHIIKHRIGVCVNGESARYKELKEDRFYLPTDWPEVEVQRYMDHMWSSFEKYHRALANLTPILGRKRAKESARFYLPYGSQITLDISFNFRSFMHFQGLRNDDHAQNEVHEVASRMLELVWGTEAFNASLAAFGWLTKPWVSPIIEKAPEGA